MNTSAIFGRYWEAESLIHSLDGRTKLLGCLALVVILFLAHNWIAMGVVAAFIIGAFLVAKIPLSQAVRSVVPILFIAVLAALFNVFFVQQGDVLLDWGWLKITSGGLNMAAFVGVRLVLLLLLGSLLTMTTTTMDITASIESLLSPLEKIGVPVHDFAFVMGTALRFLPQFAEEFHTIKAAQVARGAKLSSSPIKGIAALQSLIVPLFASVFRRADTLSAAMDARCYHGGARRTSLNARKLGVADALAITIVVALGVFVFLIQ